MQDLTKSLTYFAPGDPSSNQQEYNHVSWPSARLNISFTVFPCLVLATRKKMQNGKNKYQDAIQALDSLWGSLTQDRQLSTCNLQLDQTLDEAYFPSLSGSRAAKTINTDQVVAREFERNVGSRMDEEDMDDKVPLLMVPQLWIWRVGHCVTTAYSTATTEPNAQKPMYDGKFPVELPTNRPDLHIGLILAHHVEACGEQIKLTVLDTVSSPLQRFESALVSRMSDVEEYVDSPSSSGDKFTEKRLIHSIADIRGELAMISEIIQEQDRILKAFISDTTESSAEGEEVNLPDWNTLQYRLRPQKARHRLEQYLRRIKKIDNAAERLERSMQDKIELKRTYASIKDAHNSLLISMAVVGFTVITVIFAPLAFLTALFALDIEGFDQLKVTLPLKNGTVPDDDDENAVRVYSSKKMAGIFGKCLGCNL
ncbi:hypothetical protein K458DRAFT_176048 [Lentithecium fluviatile CBS 122367]|uniref:Ankyrin repeat protein n=1 Tax=Lentithecium fluviatile CBS 122367 TaxID=1168545 RepID=A0A6G1JCM2_9PLEO|nr:hypothetical protein K458DRAFT_176048 [Lentithecium fluviatile CBS 122367]